MDPPFDKVRALVVRAPHEHEVRALAQRVAGFESLGVYRRFELSEDEVAADVWLDPAYTECAVLSQKGERGVILIDRWEG